VDQNPPAPRRRDLRLLILDIFLFHTSSVMLPLAATRSDAGADRPPTRRNRSKATSTACAPRRLVMSAPKSLPSSCLSTTASPSISALSTLRPRTASAIPENRSVKSAPRRLQTFERSPSLRTRMRKPSCLTSWSQLAPAGGRSTSVGSHGRTKPTGGPGRRARCPSILTPRRIRLAGPLVPRRQ
jgi:hypothetical protein